MSSSKKKRPDPRIMDTKKMRVCAPLLPAPGNTVVIECLDEIDKLRHALELIRDGQKDGAKNTNIVDYINTVLTPNARLDRQEEAKHDA
jgi:hypothetical protein